MVAGHVSDAYRGLGEEPEGLLDADALGQWGEKGEGGTVTTIHAPIGSPAAGHAEIHRRRMSQDRVRRISPP